MEQEISAKRQKESKGNAINTKHRRLILLWPIGRLDTAEKGISELEDRSIKILHTENPKEKRVKKIEHICQSCGTISSSLTYM